MGCVKLIPKKLLSQIKIHKLFNSISEIFFKSERYYLNLNFFKLIFDVFEFYLVYIRS